MARIAIVFLVLLTLSTAGEARAESLPLQGSYENCGPATNEEMCLERLDELHGAGITVVLNYWAWSASPAQVIRYADRAKALEMQLIWPALPEEAPERSYPLLAEGCGCEGTALIQYAIRLVRGHPATWGYYVGEEVLYLPSPAAMAVHSYAATVHRADRVKPRLYVTWGGWGPSAMRRLLNPFADDAEFLGADYYPVGVNKSDGVSGAGAVAKATKAVADEHGRDTVAVLQAFSWASEPTLAPRGDHRWPTVSEMRRMRNLSYLRGDPAIILWFDYYFIKPPGTSNMKHLDDLTAALRAPYPVKVQKLGRNAQRLHWQQSRPGAVILSYRQAGQTHRRRLSGAGGRFAISRLELRRGPVRLRIRTVGRMRLRSYTARVRFRVNSHGAAT